LDKPFFLLRNRGPELRRLPVLCSSDLLFAALSSFRRLPRWRRICDSFTPYCPIPLPSPPFSSSLPFFFFPIVLPSLSTVYLVFNFLSHLIGPTEVMKMFRDLSCLGRTTPRALSAVPIFQDPFFFLPTLAFPLPQR